MTDKELMQEVLEALDYEAERGHDDGYRQLRDALRGRLAQPEQELVIDCPRCGHCCPQRKPLTDEEIDALVIDKDGLPNSHLEFARAIEAAHGIKEKNT